MKKLSKLLVATVIALSPFLVGVPASAQAVCDIGFTGPDSQNLCTSEVKYKCTVTNTNTVEIKNENDQVAGSGVVTVTSNTQGGNATSGTVANVNGGTFSVTITNTLPGGETSGICTAKVVVPANETPVTPVRPVGGGGGGGQGQVLAAVLPATNGDSTLAVLVTIVEALGIIVLLGMSGLFAYRRGASL